MYYAAMKKTDVANGPGVRVSLFVSGCTHRCKGCFNSEAWDFRYGREYTQETEREILRALSPDQGVKRAGRRTYGTGEPGDCAAASPGSEKPVS